MKMNARMQRIVAGGGLKDRGKPGGNCGVIDLQEPELECNEPLEWPRGGLRYRIFRIRNEKP